MMTLGIRIRTEFQNPTCTPPQFNPVQAEYHAFTQAAKPGAEGRLKIENVRTSSEVFNEVAITTSNGIEKNRQVQISSRYSPMRPIRAWRLARLIGFSGPARNRDKAPRLPAPSPASQSPRPRLGRYWPARTRNQPRTCPADRMQTPVRHWSSPPQGRSSSLRRSRSARCRPPSADAASAG